KREDYVASGIEEAEKSSKEAEAASREAQVQLKQTKQEAQKIIEDARNAGIKQEKNIVESAREEAERNKTAAQAASQNAKEKDIVESARKKAEQIKTAAQANIQNEKEKALQAVQDKVASLSVMIASKVIEKEISAQDQEKLIDEYIKEVGEEQ